jgi:hypothetical protein
VEAKQQLTKTAATTETSSSENPLSTSSAKRKLFQCNTICDNICEVSALDCSRKSWATIKEAIAEEKIDSCSDDLSQKVDSVSNKRKRTSFNLGENSRKHSIGGQFVKKNDANRNIDESSPSTGNNSTKNMPLASG